MPQPEVPIIPERSEIDAALESLVSLYDGWGLDPKKGWFLMDEVCMLLQGYKVKGLELAARGLDTFVDLKKLPWKPEVAIDGRVTNPRPETKQMEEYLQFINTTGFGLKIHLAREGYLESPCDSYTLPSGKKIRLWKPIYFLEKFYEDTLLRWTAEDVGPSKIEEWEVKLHLIKEAALEVDDQLLAQLAETYIQDWEARKANQ